MTGGPFAYNGARLLCSFMILLYHLMDPGGFPSAKQNSVSNCSNTALVITYQSK